MNEQTLSALLGAMGIALVTAVGALGWIVRRHPNADPCSPGTALHGYLETLNHNSTTQVALLQQLLTAAQVHNAEAALRHQALESALRDLQHR